MIPRDVRDAAMFGMLVAKAVMEQPYSSNWALIGKAVDGTEFEPSDVMEIGDLVKRIAALSPPPDSQGVEGPVTGEDGTAYNAGEIWEAHQELVPASDAARVQKLQWMRLLVGDLVRRIVNLRRIATQAGVQLPFQQRVRPWLLACFGPEIAGDKLERGDRFIEESLELLQSGDYPAERAHALVDYVFGRPKGEPRQEMGGVMVTLAAYALAHGLDMDAAGEQELARIWTKVEAIRAKQAAKPTGSALPVRVVPDASLAADVASSIYSAAERIFRDEGRVSVSLLQRRFCLGYNAAARIVEVLESRGSVSPPGPGGVRSLIDSPGRKV